MFCPFRSSARGSWIPDSDVIERKTSYAITMDLPQVSKTDVNVYTEGDRVVCVSGTRRPATTEDPEFVRVIMAERGFGDFKRCIELRAKIDESAVKATFKDATLTVDIPKANRKSTPKSVVTIE